MALIECPECRKMISETTPSCPHCGYQLSVSAKNSTSQKTELGKTNSNKISGIIEILVSLFLILIGGYGIISFGAGTFRGNLWIIIVFTCIFASGLALFFKGILYFAGYKSVICPYCNQSGKLSILTKKYECPVCKNRSLRDGNYLKPL